MFFIITGQIPGSQYHGTFIGRPIKTIIAETATVSTNKDNFFERASALPFLGYQGTGDYHTRAGETHDEEKNFAKAYAIVDDAYAKVRQGAFKPVAPREASTSREGGITWEEVGGLSKHGYEFASHTELVEDLLPALLQFVDQVGIIKGRHTRMGNRPGNRKDSGTSFHRCGEQTGWPYVRASI